MTRHAAAVVCGHRRKPVGLAKSVWLRCLRVFVDQSVQDGAPSDPGVGHGGDMRARLGWPLAERAVRPMFVVVRNVAVED